MEFLGFVIDWVPWHFHSHNQKYSGFKEVQTCPQPTTANWKATGTFDGSSHLLYSCCSGSSITLQRPISKAVEPHENKYECPVVVSQKARWDLLWWIHDLSVHVSHKISNSSPLSPSKQMLQLRARELLVEIWIWRQEDHIDWLELQGHF